MAKSITIVVTDDPATDSCDIEVFFTPDMDKETMEHMKLAVRKNVTRLINEGWQEVIKPDGKIKNTLK